MGIFIDQDIETTKARCEHLENGVVNIPFHSSRIVTTLCSMLSSSNTTTREFPSGHSIASFFPILCQITKFESENCPPESQF